MEPGERRLPDVRDAAAARARGGWTAIRSRLLAGGRGRPWEAPLASMLASLWCGRGVMPSGLSLAPREFRALLRDAFPRLPGRFVPPLSGRRRGGLCEAPGDLRDVAALVCAHRAARAPATRRLARVLAAGCLGFAHMWRDMGLGSRGELRTLVAAVAPALARRNDHDMKWKKFLYLELSRNRAGTPRRPPGCEACPSHDACFGTAT